MKPNAMTPVEEDSRVSTGLLRMLEISRHEVALRRAQNERDAGHLESQRLLLDRALTIINHAILQGMPITDEVADVSNTIMGTKSLPVYDVTTNEE